jgi:hypothetical protein
MSDCITIDIDTLTIKPGRWGWPAARQLRVMR